MLSNSSGGNIVDCLYLSVASNTDSLEQTPTNGIFKEKKSSKHKAFGVKYIEFGTP